MSCLCHPKPPGRAVKPPPMPIPVPGPFDNIGFDVIKFPQFQDGNQYAVVFIENLIKWPEVFAIPNQPVTTIAKLLVQELSVDMKFPQKF